MMQSTVVENGIVDYICICMLVEMGNTSVINLVIHPGIIRLYYLHVIELCLVLVRDLFNVKINMVFTFYPPYVFSH
jgi:hypothetical protein